MMAQLQITVERTMAVVQELLAVRPARAR
jgi:hypothetical protein